MPDLPALTHALFASARLLAAHPGFWLLFAVVFLVAVEGLIFLPRIGFVVKTAVGAVLGGQALLLSPRRQRVARHRWANCWGYCTGRWGMCWLWPAPAC